MFDNSLRLGNGFRDHHQVALALPDLPLALSTLAEHGAPCLRGQWHVAEDDGAVVLERAGCPGACADVCDWWREAIGGLVLGVTGGLRHTRHRSLGHGDATCVDVIYRAAESPLRYGPIPDELRPELAAVARTAALIDSTCAVEFLGLSEATLFYRIAPSARDGAVRGQPIVERSLRRRFPDLTPCEVSPRPVFAES